MPVKMNFDVEEKFIVDNYGKMKKKDIVDFLESRYKVKRSTAYKLIYRVIDGSKTKIYTKKKIDNSKLTLMQKLNILEKKEQKEYEEKQKKMLEARPKLIIKF